MILNAKSDRRLLSLHYQKRTFSPAASFSNFKEIWKELYSKKDYNFVCDFYNLR